MSRQASEPAADTLSAEVPLYVDMDGSLLATDSLWEAFLQLARNSPLALVPTVFSILRGRAAFKCSVAERAVPKAELLPYEAEVLAHVRARHAAGARSVLATGSHHRTAVAVAEHLGCFDAVLASDEATNLTGRAKLEAIERDANGRPFEYIGNARPDLPIWEQALRATVVAPSAALRAAAERAAPGRVTSIAERGGRAAALLRALRPHQWVKNVLLFVPLLLAHEASELLRLRDVILAFLCFCVIASATYVLNDLLDLAADRRHPRKRTRPFAAGTLPLSLGMALVPCLLLFGFGVSAAFLSPATTGMLGVYTMATMAYSFVLKEQLFIDVLVLAGLYTHRVLTGGVAADVVVSPWLLAFSLFFFLSLAFVKRYIELLAAAERSEQQLARRGYETRDLGLVENMGLTSGYVSILVLCLYVSSDAVIPLYSRPGLLWMMLPIMLYWITRMWFLARRGEVADDPVLFAATDRTSYVAGLLLVGVVVLAAVL